MIFHRDGVSPAEAAASLPSSPGATSLVKKKGNGASAGEVRERAAAVRTRRLMKELKEIQRLQENRPDPVFTVLNQLTPYVLKTNFNWLHKEIKLKLFL